MTTVGFVGIGIMGAGMARNLLKSGFSVSVYNRTKERAHAIEGATVVERPSDLCTADIIITCVSNDAALSEIVYSGGIVENLRRGTVLIDSGTTSIELTARIANDCAANDAHFLDAPVTGGQKGATEGTLLFMIGGERSVFEKNRSIFEAMGKRLVYCGPTTFGQRVKHALNLTQAMVLESYLEGLTLALSGGVSPAAILEVLNNSGAKSNVADAKMPAILKGDYAPNFYLELMRKDVKLARDDWEKAGIMLPLASAMAGRFEEAMQKGLAKEDWVAIAKLLEEQSGINLRQ